MNSNASAGTRWARGSWPRRLEGMKEYVAKQHTAFVVAILILAFLLRVDVAFFAGLDRWGGDSQAYFGMADAILRGTPVSYFPNGYPLLIALTKALSSDASAPTVLAWLNVVLSTAVVGLTYLMARRLLGSGLALLAALVMTFYPNQLNYVPELMTEVPTAFLVTCGGLAFLAGRYLSSSLLLQAAATFRTTLIPLVALNAVLLLVFRKRKTNVAAYVAGALVILAAVKGLEHSGIVAAPSNEWFNLVFSTKTCSGGAKVPISQEELARPIRTYLSFAAHHPGKYVIQRLTSLTGMWGPSPFDEVPRPLIRKILLGIRFPFVLLAGVAVVGALVKRHRREAVATLTLPLVSVTAVHLVFFGHSRFTYTVDPFLIVLSLVGFQYLLERWGLVRAAGKGPEGV